MNYFKPGFLLGITATPERMDNQDVFEMFDRNIPYELRLKDAIINGELDMNRNALKITFER